MKMRWEEPRIEVQKFMPNEYVAACGDHGVTYKFECNAGGGIPGSSAAVWRKPTERIWRNFLK